jgi:HlyD family secretion protein
MYGKATVYLEKNLKTLSVPSECLLRSGDPGKGTVFVVRDGKAQRKDIAIGMNNGVRAEILGGLTKDDDVIISPPGFLTNGAAVHLVREDTEATDQP